MIVEYAWIIPLLPAIAFILIILFGKDRKEGGGYIAVSLIGTSMILSLLTIAEVVLTGKGYESTGINWLGIKGFQFGLLVDQLSSVMLFVVSVIGFVIVVYSLGYMKGDHDVQRYYAEMSLFIASMLALVISSNLVLFFIAWELVGLSSYLLIGFWYRKPSAASAAKKAFLVTRVGDIMLLAGIIILYINLGTANIRELFVLAPHANVGMLTLATLLIFGGAAGKSAQFPLHVWLPDAMEGPTTVSALIHAATMVTAGIFLVARVYPLFTSESLMVVAWIGGITALMAAAMAVVMTDIKRVIAYSTISHLGFMTVALGVGGYFAGIFHLFNHSFFKALLFLCAGAVIHATHTQDIRDMGGLWKKMPITGTAFFIGAWSLSGFPPWSGFWSKDAILDKVYAYNPVLFAIIAGAVILSAVYIFRLFIIVFMGKEGKATKHAHEVSRVMTTPLIALSIGALFSGFLVFFGFKSFLMKSLPENFAGALEKVSVTSAGAHEYVTYLSIFLVALGIVAVWAVYSLKIVEARSIRHTFSPIHTILINKFYIDHIYLFISKKIIWNISVIVNYIDEYFVDGTVNGIGKLSIAFGEKLRKLQTGVVQDYAAWVLFGTGIILIIFKVKGGMI